MLAEKIGTLMVFMKLKIKKIGSHLVSRLGPRASAPATAPATAALRAPLRPSGSALAPGGFNLFYFSFHETTEVTLFLPTFRETTKNSKNNPWNQVTKKKIGFRLKPAFLKSWKVLIRTNNAVKRVIKCYSKRKFYKIRYKIRWQMPYKKRYKICYKKRYKMYYRMCYKMRNKELYKMLYKNCYKISYSVCYTKRYEKRCKMHNKKLYKLRHKKVTNSVAYFFCCEI